MSEKVKMIIFDWAGTTVDYGSLAPLKVFDIVFRNNGIVLTKSEIAGPMGLEKKEHIRRLLSLPKATKLWQEKYGCDWTEEDVDRLYVEFENMLYEVVAEYSVPIEGVIETTGYLRNKGIIIASTTGYSSDMMVPVEKKARELGYIPDIIITPDVAGGCGRPFPYMIFECMKQKGVTKACEIVKVGDTIADILEGKNAGAWTVGILEGSSILGLSHEEQENLSYSELMEMKKNAANQYLEAGADFIINDIKELPLIVELVNIIMEEEDY